MKKELASLAVFLPLALAAPLAAGEPSGAAKPAAASPKPAGAAGAPAAPRAAPDNEAIAAKLVNDCARIKEGDAVLIAGGAKSFDLLEAIAVHVRQAGAFPLVEAGSERLIKRMWDDVPAKWDAQVSTLGLKLATTFNVSIDVDYVESQGLAAHVPADRRAARGKAFEPVAQAFLKNNVRTVNLGNELYPTEERAKQFGMTRPALAALFWKGVNTDYARLGATGESVRAAIAAAKEAHLTNPNGTDLTVKLEGRPVLVSDGIISEEDMKKGGAAVQVWLPAGEVYVTPIIGTAEGKVVVDRMFYQGKEVTGLTLVFKAGKLESMTAKTGLAPLQADYDAAGPGKDVFGAIDVGINADIQGLALAWMPAGMVTVAVGDNTWAGGENQTNFAISGHVAGCTLTLDGKPLVERGKLKM